jgi:hypothetical protein
VASEARLEEGLEQESGAAGFGADRGIEGAGQALEHVLSGGGAAWGGVVEGGEEGETAPDPSLGDMDAREAQQAEGASGIGGDEGMEDAHEQRPRQQDV